MGVLILTGTCGSGKTAISTLIAERVGWALICEDDIWLHRFGKDRGDPQTPEGRRKRGEVHAVVFDRIRRLHGEGRGLVVDVTVHESPPDAFLEYSEVLDSEGIPYCLRILHPRLEVAVARDAARDCWNIGRERVRALHEKYTGETFPRSCFIDNSDETPEETFESWFASFAHSEHMCGVGNAAVENHGGCSR